MSIVEFLRARLDEDEWQLERIGDDGDRIDAWAMFESDSSSPSLTYRRWKAEVAAKRAIIEFHKQWPVLVETKPRFAVGAHDSVNAYVNAYTMHVSQQIAWMTEQEYVKRFGVEAPTTPMLRAMAAVYADHPDYREEWR